MVVKRWNRRFGCETRHPTQNIFVAKVLRDYMGTIIFDLGSCGGFLRPKTSYPGAHFGTLTQCLVHPTGQIFPAIFTDCRNCRENL